MAASAGVEKGTVRGLASDASKLGALPERHPATHSLLIAYRHIGQAGVEADSKSRTKRRL